MLTSTLVIARCYPDTRYKIQDTRYKIQDTKIQDIKTLFKLGMVV